MVFISSHFLCHHATIIAANGPLCTQHIPRQHASTSLIDIHQYRTRPRPRFVMIVTSTFLQILMLHRDEKQRYEPPPSAASSLRIVTGATHSPPISSLLSFQSILWLDMLCFDRWRLYDTPDVVVHHRHRVVPQDINGAVHASFILTYHRNLYHLIPIGTNGS